MTVAGRESERARRGSRFTAWIGLHPSRPDRSNERIPVTSPPPPPPPPHPPRPWGDPKVSSKHLSRATDEARVHRLVTDRSLNEQFQRYPHHRGTASLRGSDANGAGVHQIGSGATDSSSWSERRTSPNPRSTRRLGPLRSRLPLARAQEPRHQRRLGVASRRRREPLERRIASRSTATHSHFIAQLVRAGTAGATQKSRRCRFV